MISEEVIWCIAITLVNHLELDNSTVELKEAKGNLYDYTDIDERVMQLTTNATELERHTDQWTDAYNGWWGIISALAVSIQTHRKKKLANQPQGKPWGQY